MSLISLAYMNRVQQSTMTSTTRSYTNRRSASTLSLNLSGADVDVWFCGSIRVQVRHTRQVWIISGIMLRVSSGIPTCFSSRVIAVTDAWNHLMCSLRSVRFFCAAVPTLRARNDRCTSNSVHSSGFFGPPLLCEASSQDVRTDGAGALFDLAPGCAVEDEDDDAAAAGGVAGAGP